MSMPNDVVIVAAKRTPMGGFQGVLSSMTSPQLGAEAIKAVINQSKVDVDMIDEVLMGCVLTAGVKQAPARQASLLAQLPQHIGATTINKVCGSGMKTVMLAHDLIKAESANVVIAGGWKA